MTDAASNDAIWRTPLTVEEANRLSENTLSAHLGIAFTEVGPDFLKGTMPVGPQVHQPMGLLHGGANVALAETLGSVGAAMMVDRDKYYCVGQEINANHLRSVSEGTVTGIARPIYVGRRSQVWDIRIHDERGKMICISRLTMAAVER